MVNGAVVDKASYSYNSATGAITFKVPPPESSKIRVEWRGKRTTT
jgi:hypothetical protein